MPYDLYPAVDENYDFPPEVRVALHKSAELRNTVDPMTTVLRNNLTAAEKWDGRVIVNTDTDNLERWDAGVSQWIELVDSLGNATIDGRIKFANKSALGVEFLQAAAMLGVTTEDFTPAFMTADMAAYAKASVATPTGPNHITPKAYVDSHLGRDTGSRMIPVTPPWNAGDGLFIRRVGNVCSLAGWNLNRSTASAMSTFVTLPAGFNMGLHISGVWPWWDAYAGGIPNGTTWITDGGSSTLKIWSYAQGQHVYFSMVWTTYDAWPTTLPGVPVAAMAPSRSVMHPSISLAGE